MMCVCEHTYLLGFFSVYDFDETFVQFIQYTLIMSIFLSLSAHSQTNHPQNIFNTVCEMIQSLLSQVCVPICSLVLVQPLDPSQPIQCSSLIENQLSLPLQLSSINGVWLRLKPSLHFPSSVLGFCLNVFVCVLCLWSPLQQVQVS